MKIEFTDAPDETVGQKIGRYKILEKVGEGGYRVGTKPMNSNREDPEDPVA